MHQAAAWIADLWLARHSTNSETRRAARSAVGHLTPAVVVTGGSQGIGLALATEFLSAGRAVVLVARDQGKLTVVAATLGSQSGNKVFTIACDVTGAACYDIIAGKLSDFGCYLDVLVNSAGVGLAGPFLDHDPVEIERLIALNVTAVTTLTRAALPDMVARGRGGILNVASLGAYVPGPHQAAYYASKAYVVSLSEAIASEIAGLGVRVTALAPGPVNTGFHAAMGAERSLYRTLLPALTPQQLAASGYRGFTLGRRIVVPGLFNRLMFTALWILPHAITVPIVRSLLKIPEQNS